jgi:hypothetical protein
MPFLRDYACPEGHVTEHLHPGSASTAPASIECRHGELPWAAFSACGKPATAVIAAWVRKPGKLDTSRYPLKGQEPRRPYHHW